MSKRNQNIGYSHLYSKNSRKASRAVRKVAKSIKTLHYFFVYSYSRRVVNSRLGFTLLDTHAALFYIPLMYNGSNYSATKTQSHKGNKNISILHSNLKEKYALQEKVEE